MRRSGARPHAIKADVSTPAGARALLAKVGAVVDRLDVVVHGAVKVLVGPILDADPEAFAEAITLNGTSLVFLRAGGATSPEAGQQRHLSL